MSLATAYLPLPPSARARHLKPRVWRPFGPRVADIIGVEDHRGQLEPQMHPWSAVSLIRSPGVLTVESMREVVVHRNSLVLIPPFQLYGVRSLGDGEGVITLLLRGPEFEQRGLPAQAAIATDPALGERLAGLMSHLLPPLALVEHATTALSVLEQLLARCSPLAADRARGRGSLARVRAHLRINVSEPLTTADVARMSGLSEGQTIRSFHYEFGLPPHAYHLRIRLAAACELLTSGVAIARVAHECGFADQSHLNRRFKAVYGMTPATWVTGASGPVYDSTVSSRPLRRSGKKTLQRQYGPEINQ